MPRWPKQYQVYSNGSIGFPADLAQMLGWTPGDMIDFNVDFDTKIVTMEKHPPSQDATERQEPGGE